MRIGRGALAALAVSVVAGAISLVTVAARIGIPSSGATIVAGEAGYRADGVGVAPLPGATTELRAGDVVVAIDGRPVADWAGSWLDPAVTRPNVAVEIPIRLEVRRDGGSRELAVRLIQYPIGAAVSANWGTLTFVFVLLAVAVVVFWLRPAFPAAGALLVAASGAAGSTMPFLLGIDPLDLATGQLVLALLATGFVYLLLWAGMVDFMLVFPRPIEAVGRRPAIRLVPYVAMFGGFTAALVIAGGSTPSMLAWLDVWPLLTLLPTVATFALVPIILAWRWRRGPAEDRRLLRPFGAVLVFMSAASVVLWLIPEVLTGSPLLPWTVMGLAGMPLPIALGASIVRHRAFDLDVVVRRSLVYGGLTVGVIAIYAGAASALGATLETSSGFATSLLATGVAALLALPLRDVLQRAAGRLVYGDRDEPVRAIRRLGERLELSLSPEAMPRIVVDTVADALRLPYVALEVGPPAESRVVAERGTPQPEATARPLSVQGQPIGRLLVGARGPADPLSASDLRLLDDLSRQIGVAVHAALLTEALQESRERLVSAREEERRRLRRDLHDGLGPALAAIGMRAEAAETLLARDPPGAERLLAELGTEVAAAVADVRRLVDGLRPPAIDELGLVGALRVSAERLRAPGGPDVAFEADGALGELPAAVEVAAYRIGTEALTNAIRHAGASRCTVRVAGGPDLTLVVEDDGRGLPASPRAGVGLASMFERAAELGGACLVEPRAGGGTRVVARLPLAHGPASQRAGA